MFFNKQAQSQVQVQCPVLLGKDFVVALDPIEVALSTPETVTVKVKNPSLNNGWQDELSSLLKSINFTGKKCKLLLENGIQPKYHTEVYNILKSEFQVTTFVS